jgi:hypothetical protein
MHHERQAEFGHGIDDGLVRVRSGSHRAATVC